MKFFDSVAQAAESGVPEDEQFVIGHRTPAERDAIALALMYGNRGQRRMRRFRPGLLPLTGGAVTPEITRTERDHRNAKRRIAKQQRKRNGKK